jgi:hypothetical protein
LRALPQSATRTRENVKISQFPSIGVISGIDIAGADA